MEPCLLEFYAQENQDCAVTPCLETIQHPEHEIVLATPDGWSYKNIVGDVDTPAVKVPLELKTEGLFGRVRREWGPEGSDEIPGEYLVQVHWQMFAAQAPYSDVVALLAGIGPRMYHIEADPDYHQLLLETAQKFWTDFVIPKKAPLDAMGDEATGKAIDRFYGREDDPELLTIEEENQPEIVEMVREFREARILVEQATTCAKERENALRLLMAESGHGGMAGAWGKIFYRTAKGHVRADKQAIIDDLIGRVAGEDEEAKTALLAELKAAHSSKVAGKRSFRPYFKQQFFEPEQEGDEDGEEAGEADDDGAE
jgi:predicted phage-related endonuclease